MGMFSRLTDRRKRWRVVHCAGGWRCSVAALLLHANGIQQVSDLLGGYNAWVAAHATE